MTRKSQPTASRDNAAYRPKLYCVELERARFITIAGYSAEAEELVKDEIGTQHPHRWGHIKGVTPLDRVVRVGHINGNYKMDEDT